MAKSSSNSAAGTASSTPAAAPSAAQGASSAPSSPGAGSSGVQSTPRAPRIDPDRSAPEVQADDGFAGLNALAAQLAGLDAAATLDAPQKSAKAKLTPPSHSDDDEDDEDDDVLTGRDHAAADDSEPVATPADSDFDPDAPVFGEDEDDAEDDAEGDDDADAAGQDAADSKGSKLKSENFKLREAKRQLKADLEAAQKRLDDLETKLATVPQAGSSVPAFGGYFSQVKTVEQVAEVEARLQADLDYLDDNLDGYTYTDAASGTEVDVSRQQVRELRRDLQAQMRLAPKVLDALNKHQTRAQEADSLARKKYPFVFDPKAARNELVLDAAKEFPELSRSPVRALALGRLAVGKLVESGEYMLVKRVSKSGAAAPRPAVRSAAAAPPTPISGRNGHRQSAPQDNLGERIARGDRDALEEAALAMISSK